VPIIATDLPSLREILTDGEQARLVAADDPLALARGIEAVLADRALAARLVRGAAQRVIDYSWAVRARRILEFAAGCAPAPQATGA